MDYHNDMTYEAEPAVPSRDLHPFADLVTYVRQYTRERPEVVALTCFGVGFILGWKLKPW